MAPANVYTNTVISLRPFTLISALSYKSSIRSLLTRAKEPTFQSNQPNKRTLQTASGKTRTCALLRWR